MLSFLEQQEASTVEELFGLWTDANEEILSTIVNRKIRLSKPALEDKAAGQLTSLLSEDGFLIFPITVSSGLLGNIQLIFSKKDLSAIIDLIIGGDGTAVLDDFDELHFNVLDEAINQMAGTLESILSDNLLRRISVRLGKPDVASRKLLQTWEMVCITINMEIEGFNASLMEVLVPVDFSRELAAQIAETQQNTSHGQNPAETARPAENSGQGGKSMSMYRKAVFSGLEDEGGSREGSQIDILMDIPLELTVVLGKTRINFKDLVDLGAGSIIELEKMAGEPSEVFVNGRLVGYGEIIVIEENFGVRMIETTAGASSFQQGGKGK